MGSPSVAASSLESIVKASYNPDSDFEVVAVVTQPPAPSGRNKILTPSPVQVYAESQKIRLFTPEKANEQDFLQNLSSLSPDLCITAAYGNFLPSKFLMIPKFGTLNIHPSLLPKYRGAAPVQRCLENGDAATGVSIVFTVLKMDAGPIVKQVRRPLEGNEKAPEVLEEMFTLGTSELLKLLPTVWDGTVVRSEQDEAQVSLAAKICSADARVDFSTMSALDIHNRGRGFAGWPGLWSSFSVGPDGDRQRIKIITTVCLESHKTMIENGAKNFSNAIEFVKQNKTSGTCSSALSQYELSSNKTSHHVTVHSGNYE